MVHPVIEEQIEQNTRSQTIIHTLRAKILSGEIVSGTRLHEIPLSESMRVSRTPIREALNVLSYEALLDYRPNRGYVVKRFGLKEIVDAFTVRRALEVMACRIVGEQGLAAETASLLESLLDRAFAILGKGHVTRQDWAPYRDVDARFHWAILEATHNQRLVDLSAQAVKVPMVSSLAINWSDLKRGYRRGLKGQLFHKKIYDHLKSGDGLRAAQQMDKHFAWGIENLRNDFSYAVADDVTHFTLNRRSIGY